MKTNNPYGVKIGQIWQDWDKRFRSYEPRYIKIVSIKEGFAFCENRPSGRKSRIHLSRFRPNATGYKLIQEAR